MPRRRAVEIRDQVAERLIQLANQHLMVARVLLVDVAVVIPAAVAGQDEPRAGVGLEQVAREDQASCRARCCRSASCPRRES